MEIATAAELPRKDNKRLLLAVNMTTRPKTVEEAVDQLLSSMSEEDIEILRNTPEQDLILFHHSVGTAIRNDFGLWSGNEELLKSCGSRIFPESAYDEYLAMMVQPDSASMEIIKATWTRLNRE